jgi:hypothetical protein
MSTRGDAVLALDRDPRAPELRADLRKAWRTARRFLRLQQEHPLWLQAQAWADRLLAAEWVALIAITYGIVFAPIPFVLKIVLLIPWSLYSSLSMDVAVHYFNHWPPFRREGLNVLLRALGVLVFFSPLEVRYHHWQHHRYNDPFDDPQTALQEVSARPGWRSWAALGKYLGKETARSVWGFLPWSEMPPYIRSLKTTKPTHWREIVVTRWAGPTWLVVMLVLRPAPETCRDRLPPDPGHAPGGAARQLHHEPDRSRAERSHTSVPAGHLAGTDDEDGAPDLQRQPSDRGHAPDAPPLPTGPLDPHVPPPAPDEKALHPLRRAALDRCEHGTPGQPAGAAAGSGTTEEAPSCSGALAGGGGDVDDSARSSEGTSRSLSTSRRFLLSFAPIFRICREDRAAVCRNPVIGALSLDFVAISLRLSPNEDDLSR